MTKGLQKDEKTTQKPSSFGPYNSQNVPKKEFHVDEGLLQVKKYTGN